MVLDAIMAVLGGSLILFVTGYLLVKATWPKEDPVPELGRASIPILAVVMSMCITIIVGCILGFLPYSGKRGWFQTWGSGAPILETCLLLVSVALFLVASHRGAFPRLAARSRRGGGLLAEGGIQNLARRIKQELVEAEREPVLRTDERAPASAPAPPKP